MNHYRELLLPYWESDVVHAAEASGQIVGMDKDGTLIGNEQPSSRDIAESLEAVQLLLENDRAVMMNTARTPELDITEPSLIASRLYEVSRPLPLLGKSDSGERYYVPIEQVPKFAVGHNAHAHLGFGSGILLRHKDKFYAPDQDYVRPFGNWRPDILWLLYQIEKVDREARLIDALADIEDELNYGSKADVWPLEYRIQLEWTRERDGSLAEVRKKEAAKKIRFWQHLFRPERTWGSGAKRIDIIDESNPNTGRYVIYLVPHRSTKEHMTNRVIRKVAEALNKVPSRFSFFGAGDTMTDVRVGMEAGAGARVDFVLAAGSRIAPYLSPKGEYAGQRYAGEKLSHFTRRLETGQTDHPGVYEFMTPHDKVPRRFIIADEAFEGEKSPPASVIAGLDLLKKLNRGVLPART